MRLYLVRHAESEGNLQRQFISRADHHALTPKGIEQAEALSGVVEEILQAPGPIFSSPAERALATARVITSHASHKEIVAMEDLREVDVGELDGRSEDDEETMAVFRGIVDRFGRGEQEAAFPGGESLADVEERCRSVAETMAPREGPELLITHCLFLCGLIPFLMGKGSYDYERFYVKKAGLTILDGEPGKMSLLRFNDTSHLRAD